MRVKSSPAVSVAVETDADSLALDQPCHADDPRWVSVCRVVTGIQVEYADDGANARKITIEKV